jgi:hypothetical protein
MDQGSRALWVVTRGNINSHATPNASPLQTALGLGATVAGLYKGLT